MGKKYPLQIEEGNLRQPRIDFDGEQWTVRVPRGMEPEECRDRVRAQLTRWYRSEAKEVIGGRVFHYARLMALDPPTITVRSQKRIWGSCDHRDRNICLNWQLILAPIEVIDYVVVHELAHLVVPNHSRRFWQKVKKTLPDYSNRIKWLKRNRLDMVLP